MRKLAELGAYGVNFHDNDLVPIRRHAGRARPDRRASSRRRWTTTGIVVPMATTNLFTRSRSSRTAPSPRNDAAVRAYALQKTMRAMDLGAELGAKIYVFWGGREGTETDAAATRATRSSASARPSTSSCDYAMDQGYDMRFALEPKPNEPRGDIYLPTVGHALRFISTLDHPEMVGVNPEFAHETMAGLNFVHARRPGARGGQAVPHRPQRPEAGPLRPGLPLRRGEPQARLLPGQTAGG